MIKLLAIVMILTLVPVSQAQDSIKVYSLGQCIEYALNHNYNHKNIILDDMSAASQVNITRADGLPQINGQVEVIDNVKQQVVFIPDFINNNFDEFIPVTFNPQFSGSASVSASQLLFDGSYFIGLKASKTYKDLTRKSIEQSEIEVKEKVSKSYYSVLISKERLELLKANSVQLDSLLEDTKLRYQEGLVDKIDYMRVQVSYNNTQTQLANTSRLIQLNYNILKFQMGMPIQDSLDVMGSIEDLSEKVDVDVEREVNPSSRIEFSILNTRKTLQELDVKRYQSGYYPKLSMFGSLGANAGTQEFNQLTNFNDFWFGFGLIGARLEVPIFQGLRRSSQIQNAKFKVQKAENDLKNFELSAHLATEQARINLKNDLKSVDFQKENMNLANEVYRSAKLKYEEGVGSNLEVIDADRSLKAAETNYYSALFDAVVSRIEFEKALGTLNDFIK